MSSREFLMRIYEIPRASPRSKKGLTNSINAKMNHNNTVIVPTSRDVLNGRGQGVQRHPGNVKYRKLVFANKVRCGWAGLLNFDCCTYEAKLLHLMHIIGDLRQMSQG